MNERQSKLYWEVMNAGGRLWITHVRHFPGTRRLQPDSGRDRVTTMTSLVEPMGNFDYTPGGYRRDVRPRIVERVISERFVYEPSGVVRSEIKESYLVESLTPAMEESDG